MFRSHDITRKYIPGYGLALAMLFSFDSAQANDFQQLYAFQGGTDGGYVFAGLLRDGAQNLFGVTQAGGAQGNGTVFQLTPDGTKIPLYSFKGVGKGDGSNPDGTLVADAAGYLYGTTSLGGTKCSLGVVDGCGTAFRLAPDGTETVLHAFTAGTDGAMPTAGLLMDAAGNLFGTTGEGGGTGCGGTGCGTIFEIASDGTYKVLYAFTGGYDGDQPLGSLIMDGSGNLYGTTRIGGGPICYENAGCGTVFELTPDGESWSEKVLYSFCSRKTHCADGAVPGYGALAMDAAGNLYGTTEQGGKHNPGVVYKLAPDGTETVLHTFCSQPNCTDGEAPFSNVILDKSGNIYGTTILGGGRCGGIGGCGIVFRLAPDGTEKVLHAFPRQHAGDQPTAALTADDAGNLYGTTQIGGEKNCEYGCGTVFTLKE